MVCLNCRFPLVSILFLSNMLQCLILDLQSRIAHTQPPTIKLLAVLRLKDPRIYPKTNENEHRQNDADPLPSVEPYSHDCLDLP